MAKTFVEIRAMMIAEKNSRPELSVLNSTSETAIWWAWINLSAFVHLTLYQFLDLFKLEVSDTINKNYYGTLPWYSEVAKKFQLGDPLVLIDGVPGYAQGTTGAKIVTRATAKVTTISGNRFISLKVAADGQNPGELRALTEPELTQFKGFIDRYQPAGELVDVVSRSADRLKLTVNLFYDPLLSVALVKQACTEAVTIAYFKSLAFDGVVLRSKIEDALQSVPGVIDVEILSISARNGADPAVIVGRAYETKAGYVIPEDNAGETFSDTFNMIPNYAV